MGVDKLSLPWGKRTLLEHCLGTLLRSKIKEVIVVLNDRTKGRIPPLQGQKVKIVINPNYKKGMSTSIRRGLQAVDPKSQGILIAMGDQPLLKTKTINALIQTFEEGKGDIIIPNYRGRQGHPVLFHRKFEKAFKEIKGDVGGRSIIKKYHKSVREVRVRSEGVVKDIDLWEDYKKELGRRHRPFREIFKNQAGELDEV